uniref:Ig-like domain-containing protein n=1 Tax=Peromyscus maniculatus bairdii TaxID=230844 RepID=A0A8C8UEB5_PERMB
MTPGVTGVWLPSALLLLQVPGCVPLHGPSKVTGTVGESLSVRCQYEEEHKTNDKYWCRVTMLPCKGLVKTRASKEAGKGRVSIRDHPATLTFTVTLENLTLEDAGTYKCGVDIILSLTLKLSSAGRLPSSVKVPTSPSAPWEVLSSIYFKVLVFLEVPLLLSMLSAVLWVNRPQRCSGKKQHCPDYENQ